MGKEMIFCERCKRWLVFSKEECGYSFKEARRKEYECGTCKLQKMIECERKENGTRWKGWCFMAELERGKNVREKAEVEWDEVDRLKRKVK